MVSTCGSITLLQASRSQTSQLYKVMPVAVPMEADGESRGCLRVKGGKYASRS